MGRTSNLQPVFSTRARRWSKAVTQAIGALEEKFQTGPFACFLGQNKTFRAVQAPNYSFIVAQDRILPMLNGGPVVRSSALSKTIQG